MITIQKKVHFRRGRAGRKQLAKTPAPTATLPPGRVPRISKLMALAIHFDSLLRDGVVSDQSELARLARVSQPRMTQILNLLHLAPDIQEEILHLSVVQAGRDSITERDLRPITRIDKWDTQRAEWARAKGLEPTPLRANTQLLD